MTIWMGFETSLRCTTATPKTGNNRKQPSIYSCLLCTLALNLFLPPSAQAESQTPTEDQTHEARGSTIGFHVGGRARYESVDVAGNHGSALTTKFRFNTTYQSDAFTLHSELDYVESFLQDNHSDGVTRTSEPVIADPRGFDVNQLYLQGKFGNTEFTLGRQQVVYEDHRLIGDLGFRQNSQSFDGIKIHHEFVSGWQVDYTFVNQVNRLFGRQATSSLSRSDIRFAQLQGIRPTAQLGRHEVDGHFVHVAGRVHDYVEVFALGQSLHNSDHSPFSNRTFMLGANTRYKAGDVRWQGEAIFAKQQKHETLVDDWLSFSRLELGATKGRYQLSFRQERFGSTGGQSFITPLATLHKFQGWADRFLNTPAEGLTDNSILVKFKQLPFIVDTRYHRYKLRAKSINANREVGDEFNLDLIYRFERDVELALRYADFRPDGSAANQVPVKKLFLSYTYKL